VTLGASSRLLVVDLAARSKNWALTPDGERTIHDATPAGWRVHMVRALTSSDGDGPREPSKESMDAMHDAEVYFGFGIPKPLFLAGRNLRWVHSAAAGVGNALYPEMVESRAVLTNSAGVHAVPIAEYVVAGVLHFFRGLDVAAEQQREGRWDKQFFVSDDSPVREVAGARVLIVGAGGIGGQVALRLHALGATCIGVRRHPERGASPGFERVVGTDGLDAELPGADVVVLAAPLTAESNGFFDARRFGRLKKGTILVNVARGAWTKPHWPTHCGRERCAARCSTCSGRSLWRPTIPCGSFDPLYSRPISHRFHRGGSGRVRWSCSVTTGGATIVASRCETRWTSGRGIEV
jgi:phosphoglycerate dehydrogenase-like enzyme